MKNKKILVLLIIVLLLTGCTKQMKDIDNKVITSEETKQALVENILCQPEEMKEEYEKAIEQKKKDYKKLYKEGEISKNEYKKNIKNLLDISSLPKCSNISIIEGGYETFWTSIFVKPLAWIIVNLGILFKNNGLAIIIVTILIRLVMLPFMMKSFKQTENMKKAQPKLEKIEKKYANKNDQQSMMMKAQEMTAVYKEYNIKLASGCLFSFIQIPLFFAFYEALYRLPVLFEGSFIGLNMGMTPWAGAKLGNYVYLILPILVGLVTYFSFKANNNASLSKEQAEQMKSMFNIMIIMIFITSFSMSTAIIIYWITNSALTIIQNLVMKGKK